MFSNQVIKGGYKLEQSSQNVNSTPCIQVVDAKKVYKVGDEKVLALDGVSFTIDKGDFCILLGSSGSR